MVLKVSWEQALAWRMNRQLLDPIGTLPVPEVVRRLCGVQAQVASSAELAVRVRRRESSPGEVAAALADGRIIKTWAMRGTLHVLTPEDAGAFLALLAAGRTWERPSWERYFGASPAHIEALRGVVHDALDGRALTREELIAAVVDEPAVGHMGEAIRSGWGTLLKPLAWQGDLCFGPSQGARVTFMRPDQASPRWGGVPPVGDAAPIAVTSYLRAYGPTTADGFHNWLSRGRVAKRELRAWFAALGDRLAEVEVDGQRANVLAEDLDDLASTKPSAAVRMLPGFDQWVLGPGTEDPHVVPAGRRWSVSRQSGWIAPLVVAGGVVSGVWELDGDAARIGWFGELGVPPRTALDQEVARLASIVGRPLRAEVELT